MSKTTETSKFDHAKLKNRVLADSELAAVSGGVIDLGKNITKAVDDAISAAVGGGGPQDVWVGCAWVPQWW